ncbi:MULTISPECIES: SIMPL domain-containing protein [unclassified Neisseria]|uniref:SIMPL domain-containing protein n=1 Tax=unclassified Neisseria TaxID=2623750 RepID=UPI00266515D1|nr:MULTISPECIES: SIMPL domain-containing protein [unclassified Neisseria]MDO1509794.1 SIMPL domain-containing protein [Neisseria sp. MVDL19-042950]MDO1515882.1 SIMPL domain-containing protein [Neisseria sp. MVDL18-041461]MDO1562995.1 SIMPL domain-containing protein [Neisseria sp. MVDL20-010259]
MSEKNLSSGLGILGGLLAVGLIAASFILGMNFKNFRQPGTITVKGLAEKSFQSDSAQWTTSVSLHADTYKEVLDALKKEHPALKKFLLAQGFEEKEIKTGTPSITRSYRTESDEHGRERQIPNGYDGTQEITVRSNKLDKVQAAHKAILNLRARNEFIEFESPQYLLGNLENIKRDLINQATEDAHKRAQEFVKTGGGKVGAMRSASQGSFNIYADTGSGESDDYGGIYDKSTVGKQVRLVVTIEYGVD